MSSIFSQILLHSFRLPLLCADTSLPTAKVWRVATDAVAAEAAVVRPDAAAPPAEVW